MSTPGPLFIFTLNLGTRAAMYARPGCNSAVAPVKQLQRRAVSLLQGGEGKRKQKRETYAEITASGVETTDE